MFKQINQNSFSWQTWRGKGVGSSDVPAILQISPWVSRLELWEIKTGKRDGIQTSPWMERGKQLEAKARADYEIQYGRDMTPILIEHDEFLFMRASLDGWNGLERRVLEIKCPGKPTMELAKQGKIPPYYMAQIQYQMMLSDALIADYFCFDGQKGVCIEVKPDKELQFKIFNAVKEFWDYVLSLTPPPLSEKDYIEIEDAVLKGNVAEWKSIHKKIKDLEEKESKLRQEIIGKLNHTRSSYNDVKIVRLERPGGYDYSKMIEDFKIKKEEYQKKPTTVYQFRIDKGDGNEG